MRKPITKLKASTVDGQVVLTWYKASGFMGDARAAEFARFRIYRREERRFVFGSDYEEFFLCRRGANLEPIFEGSLPAGNDRKFSFTDSDVAMGRTYSYFVQTPRSGRIGPVPVKVRDPEVWWSYERITSRLRSLAEGCPDLVRLWACGTTCSGREIPCVEVGGGGRTLGLVGLIHGGESGPELIIPALERLVAESPDLLTAARIVAIPAVNIDARQQMVAGTPWYLRTTPAGVDLNRNFPARWHEVGYGYGLDSSDPDSATYRGPCAGAAPETRAVMSVFSERRPDVLFSFHWLASICELPALAPTCEDRRHRPYCRSVIESYARGLYPELPFSENWLAFDGTPGALPTWLYDLGCLAAFDLEGGVRAEARPCQTDQTDRSLLEEYQQRHYDAIRSLLGEWAA